MEKSRKAIIKTIIGVGVVVLVLQMFFKVVMETTIKKEEGTQTLQPAVEKLYEVHYFPNRTVIRVEGVTSDRTRKALTEIEKKYDIEEIINRSPFAYTKITIIAVPKDPNSLLP